MSSSKRRRARRATRLAEVPQAFRARQRRAGRLMLWAHYDADGRLIPNERRPTP